MRPVNPRLQAPCSPGGSFPLPGAICWPSSASDGRYDYRYERPHYAWADTVVRPVLPQPDAGALAAALGPDWTDEGLPGMTGIIRTHRPVSERPDALVGRLLQIDGATG